MAKNTQSRRLNAIQTIAATMATGKPGAHTDLPPDHEARKLQAAAATTTATVDGKPVTAEIIPAATVENTATVTADAVVEPVTDTGTATVETAPTGTPTAEATATPDKPAAPVLLVKPVETGDRGAPDVAATVEQIITTAGGTPATDETPAATVDPPRTMPSLLVKPPVTKPAPADETINGYNVGAWRQWVATGEAPFDFEAPPVNVCIYSDGSFGDADAPVTGKTVIDVITWHHCIAAVAALNAAGGMHQQGMSAINTALALILRPDHIDYDFNQMSHVRVQLLKASGKPPGAMNPMLNNTVSNTAPIRVNRYAAVISGTAGNGHKSYRLALTPKALRLIEPALRGAGLPVPHYFTAQGVISNIPGYVKA